MDQTPNILINPETAIPIGIKKRFNLKYLFIILGAVVLIEIIIGVWVFLQKNSSAGTAPGQLAENQVSTQPGDKSVNAKLSLSSVKNEFKVGEVIPVTISFATINFKAKQKGQAKVTVDFTKGSTTDTNIVGTEFPDDMLSEVKDLEVNI